MYFNAYTIAALLITENFQIIIIFYLSKKNLEMMKDWRLIALFFVSSVIQKSMRKSFLVELFFWYFFASKLEKRLFACLGLKYFILFSHSCWQKYFVYTNLSTYSSSYSTKKEDLVTLERQEKTSKNRLF